MNGATCFRAMAGASTSRRARYILATARSAVLGHREETVVPHLLAAAAWRSVFWSTARGGIASPTAASARRLKGRSPLEVEVHANLVEARRQHDRRHPPPAPEGVIDTENRVRIEGVVDIERGLDACPTHLYDLR